MRQEAVVRLAIAVLCGAALVLIVVIASGSEIDDTGGRAIGTAAGVAFFSLTGVAGTNLAARRPRLLPIGYLTIAVSGLALLIFVFSLWAGELGDDNWRPAVYTGILAFALGHTSVLLAGADDGEPEAVRAVRMATLGALGLLVALVFVEIAEPGRDVGVQPIAVVAVLYLLGVLLIPLLQRSSGAARQQPAAPAQQQAASAQPQVAPAQQQTAPAQPPPPATAAAPAADGLDHVVIAVTDLERANAFYRAVLGAEVLALPNGRTAYRVGAQRLNVHVAGVAAAPLAADPVRPGNSDLCFVWSGTAAEAAARLQALGVEVVAGPVERSGARGPGHSVYCRDPDGSLIELISYATGPDPL